MLFSRVALLAVLAVLSRAEVAFAGEAPPAATETLSKLEALVSSMADGQAAPRPTPAPVADDVVILEDEEHRRLSVPTCPVCDYFEQGTTDSTVACYKKQAGKYHCRARCPSDYKTCAPNPQASPSALVEETMSTTYVNAYLQVGRSGSSLSTQLPSPAAFGAFLAKATGAKQSHVQVGVTDGVSAQTRVGRALSLPSLSSPLAVPMAATIHATIHVASQQQKNEVVAILRGMQSMNVDGAQFNVLNVDIPPATPYPLVCTPEEDSEKAASAELLRRIAELKEQELQLLRNALQGGSSTCDASAITSLANRLGVTP